MFSIPRQYMYYQFNVHFHFQYKRDKLSVSQARNSKFSCFFFKFQKTKKGKRSMRFDDQRKIGSILIGVGFLFLVLGILLMFDSALLAIGNILFLCGLALTIGFGRTLKFFTRKERWRGIICFLGGMILVFCKWSMLGMLLQTFGFLNLFGSFFPVAIGTYKKESYKIFLILL